MRVTGRDLRVVDGAYDPDPDRIGPPEIYAWTRFRRSPAERYLRQALVAQATGHWTLAAAMRPHQGFGEARAHVSLSTGIMSIAIAFHDDAPLDEWFLYANPAIWAGQGLCQGDGRVYSRDGRLIASYTVPSPAPGIRAVPGGYGDGLHEGDVVTLALGAQPVALATPEFGITVPQKGLPLLMVTNWLPSTLVTYPQSVFST